jgi:hypothetical protein
MYKTNRASTVRASPQLKFKDYTVDELFECVAKCTVGIPENYTFLLPDEMFIIMDKDQQKNCVTLYNIHTQEIIENVSENEMKFMRCVRK